jgi:hypothetical protein
LVISPYPRQLAHLHFPVFVLPSCDSTHPARQLTWPTPLDPYRWSSCPHRQSSLPAPSIGLPVFPTARLSYLPNSCRLPINLSRPPVNSFRLSVNALTSLACPSLVVDGLTLTVRHLTQSLSRPFVTHRFHSHQLDPIAWACAHQSLIVPASPVSWPTTHAGPLSHLSAPHCVCHSLTVPAGPVSHLTTSLVSHLRSLPSSAGVSSRLRWAEAGVVVRIVHVPIVVDVYPGWERQREGRGTRMRWRSAGVWESGLLSVGLIEEARDVCGLRGRCVLGVVDVGRAELACLSMVILERITYPCNS